jgi:hypothetical protein
LPRPAPMDGGRGPLWSRARALGVDGPRLGQRIHRQSGEDATAGAKARVRPDNAPPKWVFRNITAIRENTDRILELWGLAVQGLPRSPLITEVGFERPVIGAGQSTQAARPGDFWVERAG